jgi:hypothetical protein
MATELEQREAAPRGAAAPTATLGVGYNSVGGDLRSAAVSVDTVAGGANSQVSVQVCKGVVELSQALQIKQSLSAEYAEIFKADEKMEFVRKQNATSETISIVVYARHESRVVTAKNPKLIADPMPKTAEAFATGYGDSFVSSLVSGGEYYAVYTFYTETVEKQEELRLELQGKGIVSGLEIGGGFEMAIDNFTKTSKTAWQFDQQISGIENPSLPNRKDMIDFAIKFPKTEPDSPVVISFTTTPYEKVPSFPLDFTAIAANRSYFVGGSLSGGLTASLLELVSLLNKIDWLKGIYECYGYEGDTKLDELAGQAEAELDAIRKQFEEYQNYPARRFDKPPLPSLKKGIPVLAFSKGATSLIGRKDGGGPFDYPGGTEEALHSQRRLAWVKLRAGADLDRIELRYHDIHGEGPLLSYGGTGGTDSNAVTLDHDEFIVGGLVRVSDDGQLHRINLTTNRNGTIAAGGHDGHEVNLQVPQNVIVLGFQGRCGAKVDALQLVYAQLQPAKYTARRR